MTAVADMRSPAIPILYENWRGELAVRRIRIDFIAYGNEALGFGWGSNQWHPEEQMLLSALDVDKGERRTFALAGIKAWGQAAVDAALAARAKNRTTVEGIVAALDATGLRADSPDDAQALHAAADLMKNYADEFEAALRAGSGSWTAYSDIEVDSDPSDPGCGHVSVWRVGWCRFGADDADFEETLYGQDAERRARALAATLNRLVTMQPIEAATPRDASAMVEALAAAIDGADRGHSIELTSLTEAGRVYTVDMRDGNAPCTFDNIDDAQAHAARQRSLARARAALAARIRDEGAAS